MSARPAWPGGGRVRVAGFLRGRRSSPWREIGPGPTFGAVPQTDKQRGVTGGEGSGRPSWPLEAPGWAAPGVRRKSSERPGPQGRGAGRRQPDLAGEPVRRLPLALGWGEAARGRSSGRVLWGAAGGLVWTRRRKNPVPDAQGSPPARKGLSVEWAEPVWCLGCPDWRLRVPRAAVGAGGPGRWTEFTSHCFPCPGFVAVVWSHPDTAQPGARWCGCLTLRLVWGCDFTRGPGRAFSGLLGHGCSGVNGAAGLGSGVAERRGGLPGTCGHWGVPGRVPRGVGPGGRAGAAPPPFLSQLSAEWVAQGPPWVRQQGTPALALSSPQDGEDGLGGLPLSVASGTPPLWLGQVP